MSPRVDGLHCFLRSAQKPRETSNGLALTPNDLTRRATISWSAVGGAHHVPRAGHKGVSKGGNW